MSSKISRALALAAVVVGVLALPSGAFAIASGPQTFTQSDGITIADQTAATPFPSDLAVSGANGRVGTLTATIHLQHGWHTDVVAVLVDPEGNSVMLMRNTGATNDPNNEAITFSDSAADLLPNQPASHLDGGTWKPTDNGTGCAEVPFESNTGAPQPPYGSKLDDLGLHPNGTWHLYVSDTCHFGTGAISSWSISMTTAPTANQGTFTVSADPLPGATSYTLQHEHSVPGGNWSDVATGLDSPSYSFGSGGNPVEEEGLLAYSFVADTGDTSPIQKFTVDRSGPTQPASTPDRSPDDPSGGWYRDNVAVAPAGSTDPALPDGTPGVGRVTYDAATTYSTTGDHTYPGGVARDGLGNVSSASDPLTVKVDADAPVVDIAGCPSGAVAKGSSHSVDVTASDVGSGLKSDPSGTFPLDTSRTGLQFFGRLVQDKVNHLAFAFCPFTVRTTPSAPGVPVASKPASQGAFRLTWPASHTPDKDSSGHSLMPTYELQHFQGGSWSTVASHLTTHAYSFTSGAPEDQGTWRYRVIADVDGVQSPASGQSDQVVVDRGAPNAPTLSVEGGQSPAYTSPAGRAWYLDSVVLRIADNGDPDLPDGSAGSGIAAFTPTFTWSLNGVKTASKTVKDVAGNVSAPGTLEISVDHAPPTVSATCPSGNVAQNSTAYLTYHASDNGSGLVEDKNGKVALDTSTPGPQSQSVTVHDNAGHSATSSCSYTVVVA